MNKALNLIAFILILSSKFCFAQLDVVTLNRAESVGLAEFVIECEIIEIENENYRQWVAVQSEKIGILESDISKQSQTIEGLTARLNDEKHKRQNARKSRLIWGVAGAAIGVITYTYFTR